MTGREIIEDVIRRHKVGPKDLFGYSHMPHIVKARRDAARRMFAAGLSVPVIARLMRRGPTTILYHVKPDIRRRRLARQAEYYVEHRHECLPYWSTAYRRNREAGAQQ
jgi:hypothetical protein